MEKKYTYMEMENIFEIGRTIEAKMNAGTIDYFDSKDWFSFALVCAEEFEKEYPDSDDYYSDIDEFVEKKLKNVF